MPLTALEFLPRSPFIEHLSAERRLADEQAAEALWRDDILPDLIHHLLVPRIPLALVLSNSAQDNPVRLLSINGKPVGGDYFAAAQLLKPYHVTVPWTAIGAYVTHRDAYQARGRSLGALLVGLAAGLTEPEISQAITDSTVDLVGWRLLHTLREKAL
jgi:hypothetical protein